MQSILQVFTTLTQSQIRKLAVNSIETKGHLNSFFSFNFLSCCFAALWLSFGLLLRGETQSSNVNHCCFIAIWTWSKKELHKEVKSQWSTLRGFNWQHSKPYIMSQPSKRFRHTIFSAKFNMLTSFIPHFPANIEGAYTAI